MKNVKRPNVPDTGEDCHTVGEKIYLSAITGDPLTT